MYSGWFAGRIPSLEEGILNGTYCRNRHAGTTALPPNQCCDQGGAEAQIMMCPDGNPIYR